MENLINYFASHPKLIVLLSAELVCILIRQEDVKVIAKSKSQRTEIEQHSMDRGVLRAMLLELFVFVPVSVALLLLLSSPIASFLIGKAAFPISSVFINALLGVLSYGFPFATLREVITKIALNTLSEFASITAKREEGQLKG